MDFNGITWAGNVYQKFETMCLEVEEVMYEDTIKYVENQVQNVGGSLKKFCSEVMQDILLPQSCANTEKNKPKPIMLCSLPELKKKKTKDEDICDLAEQESSLRVCNEANLISPPSLTVNNRRLIGIKRISRNNVNNASISDASAASLASGKTLLADCVMPEKHDFEHDSCANDTFLSDECLRQKKDGSHCLSSFHSMTTESIDKSGKDDSFSHINSSIGSNACVSDSAVEEVISCYEDNFDMEIIYKEEDAPENSKMEETCILVEGSDLRYISQGTEKQKSYKKKIREALLSKLRLRKQTHFNSQDKNDAASTMESDWELL